MPTVAAKGTRARVVVVDDHPVYRESLEDAIRAWPELELVGSAADGASALRLIRDVDPDVAVLDLRLPDVSGIEVIEAVRRSGLRTRTVLLSAFHEPDAVYETVAAGASAYLSKESSRRDICASVTAVGRGETVMGAAAQAGLVAQIRHQHGASSSLTPREREVLSLTADGLSTPAIAIRLGIGEATVRTHVKGLYAKLGVRDRAAAVAVGWRRQLLR